MEPHEYCHVDHKQFGGHKDEVNCVAFSSDYEMMITGSDDCCLRIFNTKKATLVCRLKDHKGAVRCVAVTNDSRHFASGSYDKSARIYQTRDAELLHLLLGHEKSVECMAFSYSGHLLITGSWDKTARVWDVGEGSLLTVLRGHKSLVQSVVLNFPGNLVATGSWDYKVRVWTLPSIQMTVTKKIEDVTEIHQSQTNTPDDVITSNQSGHGSGDQNDAEKSANHLTNDDVTGDSIRDVMGNNDVGQSGDDVNVGKREKTGSAASAAILESMLERTESMNRCDVTNDVTFPEDDVKFLELRQHTGNVYSVAFSRAGMLASASWDKTVCLWNPSNGRLLHVLNGHTGWVRAVNFTFDGFYCASVADDEELLIWDVVTGECRRRLEASSDTPQQCGFTPGGAVVAIGGNNTTLGFL